MSQTSFHENYREDAPATPGSDRAFGCTVGSALIVIAAAKAFVTGIVSAASFLIFVGGAVLLCLGIVAPSRLCRLNRLWWKIGTTIAKVVNPVVLALLFYLVITPMALIMRVAGKRPLRLAPDRAALSYWIARDSPSGGPSSMKRQF